MIKKLFYVLLFYVILVTGASLKCGRITEGCYFIVKGVIYIGDGIVNSVIGNKDTFKKISIDDLSKSARYYYKRFKEDDWKTQSEDLYGETIAGKNYDNSDGLLPRKTDDGKEINYKEYDTHTVLKGELRGPYRFIHGDDGSTYYTDDNYETFEKIV